MLHCLSSTLSSTRKRGGNNNTHWRTLLLLLISLASPLLTLAKIVEGDFKLSGVQTEYVLTKFALLPAGGRVTTVFTATDYYPNDNLRYRLYRDVEWPKYQKALTCTEKIKYAQQVSEVSFEKDGDLWKASVPILMFNDKDGTSKRSHYWYFVVDDCSLEEYFQDNRVPKIHFHLTVQNHVQNSRDLLHLSADEQYLTTVHTMTLVISILVVALLAMNIGVKITQHASVHAALLWVTAAASLDAGSSLFELLHLKIYEQNGIGSYFLDAMAAHMEAICDSLLILLLLSVAAGWTLPSDVVSVNPNSNTIQRLLSDLSRPVGSLLRFNAAGALVLLVIASHVILAQWGRTYNDDFESYHDYEHLPGKILMASRIFLGVLLLAATTQTRLKCTVQQLRMFYLQLAVLGFAWCQSLPFLTWASHTIVPYHLKHPAVFVGSALAQTVCILLLAWLVTAHSSAYHHYSHMAQKRDSLTDTLSSSLEQSGATAAPTTFKFGKAKVRLD